MKILFVCTGNSCRSVMAMAYLRKRLKELGKNDIEVFSAGIAPSVGMEATKEARQVLSEEGADVSNHFARKLTELDIHKADLIFVMEKRHKNYVVTKYPLAERKTHLLRDYKRPKDLKISNDHDIADPIGRDIDFYREVFLIIRNAIDRMVKEF